MDNPSTSSGQDKIVLFHPYLSESAKNRARLQMDNRWIGEGPLVEEFEKKFENRISGKHRAIAVNSGTSALHLAYILAGIKEGEEVIGSVFTCSASYSGILYQGAKMVFADIEKDTMNIDPNHVEELFKQQGERIKAIIAVDYAGMPCNYDRLLPIAKKWNVPIIEDAAQAIGATYKGKRVGEICQYTAFSFQAVKTITTGDGGMLTIEDPMQEEQAKRIRWFGIDRKAKFEDRWKQDIWEVGFKYQMTSIEAAMGIEGLNELDDLIEGAKKRFEAYKKGLEGIPGIRLINKDVPDNIESSYWLCTVETESREALKKKLLENNIESNPVHYRADRYKVYGGRVYNCPNMDALEHKYLVLPMHHYVTEEQVAEICSVIKSGW